MEPINVSALKWTVDYLENLYKYKSEISLTKQGQDKSNLDIKGFEFLPVLYLYPLSSDFYSAITASRPNPDK